MPDNVIVGKAEIIERCIGRAREELAASTNFETDYTRQDAAILNVERACEAAIDIMTRIVRLLGLGIPSSDDALANRPMRMVAFRNLAVHQYQKLDIAIVRAVIEKSLDDLLELSAIALRLPVPDQK